MKNWQALSLLLFLQLFLSKTSAAQLSTSTQTNRFSFLEANVEKGFLRFDGQHITLDNNESAGNLFLQANGDLNFSAFDDVILKATDDISLATGSGNGLTRLFINQDGDVGIGTTSPDQKLDILGNLALTNGTGRIEFKDNSTLKAFINMGNSDLTIENEVAGGDSDIRLDANGDIEFQTGSEGSTNMLLNNVGKLMIGATSGADGKVLIANNLNEGDAHLELFGTGSTGEAQILFTADNPGSGGQSGWKITGRTQPATESRTLSFSWINDGIMTIHQSTQRVTFDADVIPEGFNGTYNLGEASSKFWGNVYAQEYLTISDGRLKNNVRPLKKQLAKFMRLRPVTYRYNKDRSINQDLHTGFIAQEMQQLFPTVVADEKVRYDKEEGRVKREKAEVLSINYQELIPITIKVVQEQQAIIAAQTKTIEDLEKRLRLLEKRVLVSNSDISLPKEKINPPKAFLQQNQPNPFTNQTTIAYQIPESTKTARLQITNLQGQVQRVYPIDQFGAGQLTIELPNGQQGQYYYSLVLDGEIVATRGMVVMK
ncbi:MAG: tail fiber domain-containing protein [Bacteroidota bacterium]